MEETNQALNPINAVTTRFVASDKTQAEKMLRSRISILLMRFRPGLTAVPMLRNIAARGCSRSCLVDEEASMKAEGEEVKVRTE